MGVEPPEPEKMERLKQAALSTGIYCQIGG